MSTSLARRNEVRDWGKHFREVSQRRSRNSPLSRQEKTCGTTSSNSTDSTDSTATEGVLSSGPQFGGHGHGGGHGGHGHGGYGFGRRYYGGGYGGWYGWPGYDYWPYDFYQAYEYPDMGTDPIRMRMDPSRMGEDSRAYPGGYFGAGEPIIGYSVSDINDLIRAKDVEMAAIDGQIRTNPSTDSTIVEDWKRLQARYGKARSDALVAVSSSLSIMPDSLNITANTNAAYKAIVSALQQNPMSVTKGDKQDIANRLMAKGWKPKYKVPQPQQGPSEKFEQWTDPKNIEDAAKKALHIPRWAYIAGGVAVFGLGVIAIKGLAVGLKASTMGLL